MEGAPASDRPRLASRLALVASAVWLLAGAAGFAALWRYKSAPGTGGEGTPEEWPARTSAPRSPHRATLLLFAHPRCVCTRASIAELARLMSRQAERVDAAVLFWTPPDAEPGWSTSDLWTSASRIPGVAVMRDEDGREARRFGVATSGGVVLYDRRGRLLFKGGITPARGHEGDSFGQERIASLLTTGAADRADAPVFGCELETEATVRIAQSMKNQGGAR